MLTDTSTDFEAPQGARANGTHHRNCPGQPTSHLPREQAIPKQAPSGHPTDRTTQRTERALDRFSHPITMPRCSDQPATPTTVPDCTHTHTHASHLRDPTSLTGPRQQATHSQPVPVPDPRAQGGSRGTGAGQATGAPRPQPRRRHPKGPNTNTPNLPSASPRNQPTAL